MRRALSGGGTTLAFIAAAVVVAAAAVERELDWRRQTRETAGHLGVYGDYRRLRACSGLWSMCARSSIPQPANAEFFFYISFAIATLATPGRARALWRWQ